MFEYATNTTYKAMAGRIRSAERIALVPHAKPDGDALGSALALARALPQIGCAADILVMGPIEPPLLEIAGQTPLRMIDEEGEPQDDAYQLIMILDTGAWSQLDPLGEWLRRQREKVIAIDHHSRGEDVASQRVVDPDASATAEMMIDLLDVLDCELTGGEGGVAEPLYVGMATDTGWFRYENAQARTFAMAARLLEHGVDKSRLYQLIEETHPVERLRLEARALASLEFVCGDSVAIQSLRMRDFKETGCTVENLTGVVNLPMIARQVRVSVLLSEVRENHTKLSFRAKPALGEMAAVNVNELAGKFGGGGHVLASGARLDLPLDQARERLLEALSC